jgi:hypothetical protein
VPGAATTIWSLTPPPEDFAPNANSFTSVLVIDGIEEPSGLPGSWREPCIDAGQNESLASLRP